MKFNTPTAGSTKTTNHEGATAYKLTPELELYIAVVTSTLSNKFYESGQERIERIRTLISQNKPEFVARLAVYARQQMHLRSMPLVLAVELAKVHKGDNLVSRLVNQVVLRADEITELLAYYQIANEREGTKKLGKLSKQIQKGLAAAFNRFDEYQFAKYNRAAEIKLRDALFLVHSKAKDDEQQAIFDKIVADTLEVPYTWETNLSATGQKKHETEEEKSVAFKAKWEELIDSRKMGYMATMRNLRNILEAKVSQEHIQKVASYLSNEKAVLNSKQLPFRFLAAYRELQNVQSVHTSQLLDALEQAVSTSAQNIAGFDGDTSVLLACDVSGSMQKAISPKSKILAYDIGLMLAMLLQSRCTSVVTGMFGDRWKVVNMPRQSVLSNVQAFYRREGEVGYSTNGHKVIADLIDKKQIIDKVMIFTDCQLHAPISKYWAEYKHIAPNAKLYLFDLAGYGNTPISIQDKDVHLIAGWSDKVFDILHALENAQTAVDIIKATQI